MDHHNHFVGTALFFLEIDTITDQELEVAGSTDANLCNLGGYYNYHSRIPGD